MEKKLIKIKSISDAITNSSTEVFLVKNDDKFKEFSKDFRYVLPCTVFATEEDVKKYFEEYYNYSSCCYDAEWLSDFLDANPFANYEFIYIKHHIKYILYHKSALWSYTKENGGIVDRI